MFCSQNIKAFNFAFLDISTFLLLANTIIITVMDLNTLFSILKVLLEALCMRTEDEVYSANMMVGVLKEV